jgi:NAD(P)-dependent dehydrogenase (short-subunit alcohol dehydrogenase family)
MSGDLRFDERVAIVTGAGGENNLGRAYAMELAARGAKVVVNDSREDGDARVVDEITAAGGEAIASVRDIAQETTADAVVQAALDAWGRVDVLVNNGGRMVFAFFDEMSSADTKAIIDSHVLGAVWMSRAVWPHLEAQGYGRIVNALSTANGIQRVIYGTAKAALFGLTYGLALSGREHGIRCNGIVPLAGTDAMERTVEEGPMKAMLMAQMRAELVAPVVAYLAHEECPVTGEAIFAAGGRVALFHDEPTREGDGGPMAALMTGGYASATLTAEEVRERWSDIVGADFRPLEFPDEAALGMLHRPYQP